MPCSTHSLLPLTSPLIHPVLDCSGVVALPLCPLSHTSTYSPMTICQPTSATPGATGKDDRIQCRCLHYLRVHKYGPFTLFTPTRIGFHIQMHFRCGPECVFMLTTCGCLLFTLPGTCINNTGVFMFKKGCFELGATIYPAVIKVSGVPSLSNTL